MRLNDSTLDWLMTTHRIADQIAAAGVPDFGWCGTSRMYWNSSEENFAIKRVFRLAGLSDLPTQSKTTGKDRIDLIPRNELIARAPTFFVNTCRTLQDLQPLYLIPHTPENTTRIAAQTQLVCSLYRLAVRLVGIEGSDDSAAGRLFQGTDPLMSRYSAYLLAELQMAKKVGVLPLVDTEVLTSS